MDGYCPLERTKSHCNPVLRDAVNLAAFGRTSLTGWTKIYMIFIHPDYPRARPTQHGLIATSLLPRSTMTMCSRQGRTRAGLLILPKNGNSYTTRLWPFSIQHLWTNRLELLSLAGIRSNLSREELGMGACNSNVAVLTYWFFRLGYDWKMAKVEYYSINPAYNIQIFLHEFG